LLYGVGRISFLVHGTFSAIPIAAIWLKEEKVTSVAIVRGVLNLGCRLHIVKSQEDVPLSQSRGESVNDPT
jgi:hypothetical protein